MEKLRLVAAGQRSKGFEWGFCCSAFAIAFGARYYLEGALPPGFPYLTFFPAVILTGFFASTRAGSVVAVLCGLASWYFFLAPQGSWALTWPSVLALAFYVFIVSTDLFLIHVMRMALTKLGDERATSMKLAQSNKLMFHELQHRVSNNLQVISSLLKMQQRNLTNDSAKQALETASARLQVVSNIQRQLHNPKRQSSDIGQVLRDVLPEVISSSGEDQRVRLQFDTQPLVVTGDQATQLPLSLSSWCRTRWNMALASTKTRQSASKRWPRTVGALCVFQTMAKVCPMISNPKGREAWGCGSRISLRNNLGEHCALKRRTARRSPWSFPWIKRHLWPVKRLHNAKRPPLRWPFTKGNFLSRLRQVVFREPHGRPLQ